MKHATPATLSRVATLLDEIRARTALKEKTLGVFYRRSKASLHFHEDPAGLFADFDSGSGWNRFPVNSEAERRALLDAIDRALGFEP